MLYVPDTARWPRDFLPSGIVGPSLGDRLGGEAVASRSEVLGDGTIRGEEALGMTQEIKPCMRRSRWRVGWWEFSARLLR